MKLRSLFEAKDKLTILTLQQVLIDLGYELKVVRGRHVTKLSIKAVTASGYHIDFKVYPVGDVHVSAYKNSTDSDHDVGYFEVGDVTLSKVAQMLHSIGEFPPSGA